MNEAPRIKSSSADGRAWLVRLEGGVKLKAYRVNQKDRWTIGPGLTKILIYGQYRRVEQTDRFNTEADALGQFYQQLQRYEAEVDGAVRDDLTQTEFDSFTAFCWNCEAAFNPLPDGRMPRWNRLFNQRAPMNRVCDAIKEWNKQGNEILPGLIERRACEVDLLLKGVYRTQGQKV